MPSSIVLLLFLLRLVSAVANLYDTKSRAGRFRRRDDVAGVHVRDVSCGPAFGPCPPGECCSPEGNIFLLIMSDSQGVGINRML